MECYLEKKPQPQVPKVSSKKSKMSFKNFRNKPQPTDTKEDSGKTTGTV